MHLRGFRNLCFFYACWLGGSFVIPVAVLAAVLRLSNVPLIGIISYYAFRWLMPASKWTFMREALCTDDTPYSNTANIFFEEGAEPPKPFSKLITTVAPHGILTLGWSYVISSRDYFNSENKWLVAPAMMKLPFVSDVMHWTGCTSCAADNMVKIMKTGCNMGLIPGGFQEATYYRRGEHHLYLKKRKGFIKYALKYGYDIQPLYVFGEEFTFWTLQWLPTSLALWLNSYNIPTYLFMGRFFFMPDWDMDITCVVGKTIKLPQIDNPTADDVDKYHAIFIQSYRDLFDKNKAKYAKYERGSSPPTLQIH